MRHRALFEQRCISACFALDLQALVITGLIPARLI
jgi:hypothetical protein